MNEMYLIWVRFAEDDYPWRLFTDKQSAVTYANCFDRSKVEEKIWPDAKGKSPIALFVVTYREKVKSF